MGESIYLSTKIQTDIVTHWHIDMYRIYNPKKIYFQGPDTAPYTLTTTPSPATARPRPTSQRMSLRPITGPRLHPTPADRRPHIRPLVIRVWAVVASEDAGLPLALRYFLIVLWKCYFKRNHGNITDKHYTWQILDRQHTRHDKP